MLSRVLRFLLLPLVLFMGACGGASGGADRPNELADLALAAATGDSVAQYDLAVAYFRGEKVAQDYSKAAALWRPLAERGHPEANNNLGYLTYYGYGVPEDPAAAVLLWRRAIALGVAESSFHLGHAFLQGRGIPRDSIEGYARIRAAELLAAASADSVDHEVAAMARAEILKLIGPIGRSEREIAERRARAYAGEPVAAPDSPRR
jgi:hypothetical protein